MAIEFDKTTMGDADDLREWRVTRDGARDLSFKGWLLGEGSHGTGGNSGFVKDWTRGVEVSIFLTTGGRLITGVKRWSRWQGEGDKFTAETHDLCDTSATIASVLGWLREDGGGYLGVASKEAWEEACKTCPALAKADVETID